ncbi:MAG: hemagglutinin repeat-containing protein [Paraburkholderia tropica]
MRPFLPGRRSLWPRHTSTAQSRRRAARPLRPPHLPPPSCRTACRAGRSAVVNNTHINAGNSATILSGGDTNIIGANVNARQVNADVGGNLNIASVQDTMTSVAHQESSGGGFSVSQSGASGSFSSQHGDASGNYAGVNEQAGIQAGDGGFNVNVKGNTDLKGATIASTADAANNNLSTGTLSLVSADAVSIASGNDINVKGSTIVGSNDVNLAAIGNVTITTSQNTQISQSSYSERSTGFGAGGGIGISYGTRAQTDTANDTAVSNNASTVGSLNGSVNISAGKDLHVTGSDLIAAQNVTGTGQNVTIDSAVDTAHHDESHEVKQSGFTLAIKAPVIDAISNTVDQSRAASRSKDDRAAALHGMAAASGAIDSLGAAGAALGDLAKGQKPEAKIELSYGSSHSKSTYTEDSSTNRGSSVAAGGTAAFAATGDGTPGSGNLTIAGSNVNANDVILAASNKVNLVNTTDTDSTRSTNESSSGSVGISYGTSGFGVDASMSKAHGNANSDSPPAFSARLPAFTVAEVRSTLPFVVSDISPPLCSVPNALSICSP